jgi:signal transduction histidine kinase
MLATGIAGEMNAEQQEFVETIRNKGDHLLALITSLLDLNKLEQGSMRLHREVFEPGALVTDLKKTMAPSAAKKNVAIEATIEKGLARIDVDPVRIRQVLFNIAENALKFSPPGGVVKMIARSAEVTPAGDDGGFGAVLLAVPEKRVEIGIIDSGIGIPKDEQEKIFDAFYQVDGGSTREHGGTGLGLSIVKRIVEAHGGTVRVESDPGKGAAFWVSLPEHDDAVG